MIGGIRSRTKMKGKVILAISIAGLLLGLGFLIYKTADTVSPIDGEIASYQTSDLEKPQLKVLGEATADLGTIGVNEEKSATFKIRNEGQEPLQIFYGATNCGCTFGRVKTASGESPLFGMHSNQDFLVEIAPPEEAEIQVIYRPYLMPVHGRVTRTATIKTNDPESPRLTFTVEAFVE